MATRKPGKKPAPKKKPKQKLASAPTGAAAKPFLAALPQPTRDDAQALDALLASAVGAPGVMFGKAIVGYGEKTIRYADGREAPWMKLGFAPRKDGLVLYGLFSPETEQRVSALLPSLGKGWARKGGCLHLKRLSDVDSKALARVLAAAVK